MAYRKEGRGMGTRQFCGILLYIQYTYEPVFKQLLQAEERRHGFVLSTKQASLYGKALSHFPQWKKPQRGSMFPRTVHRGPQWQKERVEKGSRYDGESARSEAIIIPSPSSSFPSKRTTKRREGGERRKEPISHLFPLLSPSPLLLLFPGSSFFPHWGNFSSTASSVFLCCYTPPDAAEKEGEKKIGDGEGRGGSKRMDGRGRQ